MPDQNEQYLFAALKIPNKVSESLANLQRDIALLLKQQDRKHKLVPRRMFLVPMFDLKRAPLHSEEAVVLAFEKARDATARLELKVDGIACWPSAEDPQQIVALLVDTDARLRDLRARSMARIEDFGFSPQQGDWQPFIPLIRLVTKDESAPLEIELPQYDSDHWSVNAVSLFGREIDVQRSRFQIRARVRLDHARETSEADETSEESIRAGIAEELQRRIEARKVRLSESKRSERAKVMRDEEQSSEPQPIDAADDMAQQTTS